MDDDPSKYLIDSLSKGPFGCNMNLEFPNQSVDFQGSERTADYSKLLEYGLDSKVADKLDDIYKVKHLNKCELTWSENEKCFFF